MPAPIATPGQKPPPCQPRPQPPPWKPPPPPQWPWPPPACAAWGAKRPTAATASAAKIILRNITQSPAWKRSTQQSSVSLVSLGHSRQAFRNKCRHISLKQAGSHSAPRSQKGKITVTNPDPFAEG